MTKQIGAAVTSRFGIRIKTASIQGHGLGLFATKAFKKGDDIAPYAGDLTLGNNNDGRSAYILGLRIKGSGQWMRRGRMQATDVGRTTNAESRRETGTALWSR